MAGLTFYEKLPTIKQLKQLIIKEALKRSKGDHKAAAEMANISRPTFRKYLRKLQAAKYLVFVILIMIFN